MLVLAISGLRAQWREPTGRDDIALADGRSGLADALDYVRRSVGLEDGSDPADLPVGDLDLLVVWRRREQRGDGLVAEGRCGSCDAPVDIRFSLAAYAAHNRPRRARTAKALGDGWFELGRGAVFRLPRVADVLAALETGDPRRDLLERCVREPVSGAVARSVESAMAALAPTLRATVAGTCPECGEAIELDVDARELCLAELRHEAVGVYDDVNLIASTYNWTQDDILDLPSERRHRYADTIAGRPAGVVREAVGDG